MELLAASPQDGHEVRLLQHGQVLGHSLPGHVQVGAELPERLPVVRTQSVQQLSPASVGQCLEHPVHVGIHASIMQPVGCMSRPSPPPPRNTFLVHNLWLGAAAAGIICLWRRTKMGCSAMRGGVMHVPLSCQCGKRVLVTEGSAGATLPCECGRSIQVPPLGELRRRVADDDLPYVPSRGNPPANLAVRALLTGCGAVVFLLGAGLFLGNITGLFPTLPFAGYLVMTIGGLLLGAGAITERAESQLDRAFRVKVETKLSHYREWSHARAFTGGRLLQYRGLDLVGARDVALPEVESQVEGLLYQGFHVDWAEHQGRLYLRVWEFAGPEPAWPSVLAEQPLTDTGAIQHCEYERR